MSKDSRVHGTSKAAWYCLVDIRKEQRIARKTKVVDKCWHVGLLRLLGDEIVLAFDDEEEGLDSSSFEWLCAAIIFQTISFGNW
jgi:hypothetical protein